MKRLSFIIVLCLCVASIYAQSSEERRVGNFTGVKTCAGIEVFLKEGKSSTITVKADTDIRPLVKTSVKGGILNISIDNNAKPKGKNVKVQVYVSAQGIKLLEASSSGSIKSTTGLNAENIKLKASSSGRIELTLVAKKLTCDASSSGTIKLKGAVESVNASASSSAMIDMTGLVAREKAYLRTSSSAIVKMKGVVEYVDASSSSASKIDMPNLIANRANIQASSGASISLEVKHELKARASSGGTITYKGNPVTKDVSSSSGGNIKRK